MASAAQLKKLRKKYGLGEFKKKKRRKAYKLRHKSYHQANRKYSRRRPRSKSKRPMAPFVGTSPASVGARMPLGPTFPAGTFNPYIPPMPEVNSAVSSSSIAAKDFFGDTLIRSEAAGSQTIGWFQRPDGTTYKKYI